MKNRKLIKIVMGSVACTTIAATMLAITACNTGDEPGGDNQPTQLTAPEITLTDNVITWNAVEHADSYTVIEDSTTVSTQTTTTYTIDKSVAGDYTYTVVATSTNDSYTDSVASNSVTYSCYTVTFNANGGVATVQSQLVAKGGKVKRPEGVLDGNQGVMGWFTDSECNDDDAFDFSTAVTGPLTLYAKWGDSITTTADIVALANQYGNKTKIPQDVTVGKFSYTKGLYFETAGTVNTQKKDVAITVEGLYDSNEISFTAAGASSTDIVTLTVKDSSGKTVHTWVAPTTSASANIKITGLKAGKYTVSTTASCRLSKISVTEVLEKGAPTEITEVIPQKVDFLIGDKFSSQGLTAKVLYDNGGTRTVSDLQVDNANVHMDTEGKYTVGVSYTAGEGADAKTVNGSYDIYVYSVDDIKLETSTTNGNVTTNLQTVYVKGGTFSSAGLTVIATAKCDYAGAAEAKQAEFKLSADQYDISGYDLSQVGTQTVTVTAKANSNAKATYSITVKETAVVDNNQVTVTVDKNGGADYTTITEALQYLKASNLEDNVVKIINIADGEYYEKVSIDIPNVRLVGSKTNTPDATTNNGVVIWYDAISGLKDASGASYGTNGSASVTVTSKASNFVAQNITFKNKYNTFALYRESLKLSSNSQAVALLIESNSASFYNCKMTSYHDTLYANKGNHYFEKCWIEGHTDFIFGSTVHGYFNDCTIYSIAAYKIDNENITDTPDTNGGYIVASQGNSSYYYVFNNCDFTAEEGVLDGSIALGRAWGADMKMVVINSTISEKYSTTAHTAGKQNGDRYCTMSGNEPKPENMLEYNNTGAGAIDKSLANTCTYMTETQAAAYQLNKLSDILGFTPINPDAATHTVTVKDNTGTVIGTLVVVDGGVITEGQINNLIADNPAFAGKDFKAAYSDSHCTQNFDLSTTFTDDGEIFVTLVIGPVSKDTSWDFKTEKAENQVTEGTKDIGKLHVDATNGTFVYHNPGTNSQWSKLTGSATLSLNLKADTIVTVTSYDDGLGFAMDGATIPLEVVFENNMYTVKVREAGTLVISRTKNGYVGIIEVNVDAGISMEKHTVTLYNGATSVGTVEIWEGSKLAEKQLTELMSGVTAPTGQEFKGFYTDPACSEASAFVDGTVISADASVYIGWKTATAYIEETTTINFGSNGNYKNYIDNGKLVITNPSDQVGWNGEEQGNCNKINEGATVTIPVKAGATVIISSYSGYTNYTVNNQTYTTTHNSFTVTTDGNFVITSGANNYIYSISVVFLTKINSENQGTIYTYSAPASGNEYTYLSNSMTDHNGYLLFNDNSAFVAISVDAGATIKVTSSEYGHAIVANGETMTPDASYNLTYVANTAGIILLTRTGTAYLTAISVTYA